MGSPPTENYLKARITLLIERRARDKEELDRMFYNLSKLMNQKAD